ncbi:MAG: hypothetical protein ABI639_13875 [Thermoanaerobaculia bacterium]
MGLKEVLSKLKLVEVTDPDPPSAPSTGIGAGTGAPQSSGRGASPRVSAGDSPELEELLRNLPPPRPVDASLLARGHRPATGSGATTSSTLSAAPASSSGANDSEFDLPDFPAVYRSAGIADPPHGFTAFKVLEMLQSPGLAELSPQAKASALVGFLKMNPGGPVAIGDIIQDAVRRDQALDKFEQFLHSRLAERTAAAERANGALQSEIDALSERHRATMAANERGVAELAAKLSEWSAGKRAEERKLQSAVAPFVDGNPITTDSAAAPSRST